MWPPALGDQVYRNIILFDKHVRQLDQTGLESVLANKIGHYKKAHILKTIALAVVGSLPFLFLVAVMAKPDWLLRGCSFAPGDIVPALLLAGWPGDILGVPGDSSFVASP